MFFFILLCHFAWLDKLNAHLDCFAKPSSFYFYRSCDQSGDNELHNIMDDNKTVVEDNAMDLFMSGPFLQWVRNKNCVVLKGFNLNLDFFGFLLC